MSGEMYDQAVIELARFLGEPVSNVSQKVKQYSVLQAKESWDKARPQTPEQVEQFYKDTDHYLYELIPWNYGSAEFHRRVSPLFHYHNYKILEIGAGIGSLCIALWYAGNQVTYCDINPRLIKFAQQRFIERQMYIPIVSELTGLRDFDMVVAIDTLEHIHPDKLFPLLKEIAAVLKDGGFLYHRSNFGQQDIFPMHYNHSEYLAKMCKDAGLNLRENGDYVKGGDSVGVQIGLPIVGNMNDVCFYSFLNLKKKRGWKITKIRDTYADSARNRIIEKLEKDWLFFMDSDMSFHPDTLERLLAWDLPVVSGLYFKPAGNPIAHAYTYAYAKEEKDRPKDYMYMSIDKEITDYLVRYKDDILAAKEQAMILPARKEDLIPIDGCGAGCLLVHRRVIEKLEKPYFKYIEGSTGGEDFYFCRKIRDAGFPIYLDVGVICGHMPKESALIGAKHFLHYTTTDHKKLLWPYPFADGEPEAKK